MVEERQIDQVAITRMRDSIIEIHEQIMISMKETIHLGLKAGEILLAIKNELPHGAFGEYIESNFPFGIRTAQRYIKIASNPDKLEETGAKMLTEAYDSMQSKPPEPDISEAEVSWSEEDLSDDGKAIDDYNPKPEKKVTAGNGEEFWYWPKIESLIESIELTYRQLSAKRNSATPRSLGMFIGNLQDMANRLKLWNPDNLVNCTECEGVGTLPVEDSITGELTYIECPHCINGFAGPFAQSKN